MYSGVQVIYTENEEGKDVGGFFAEIPANSLRDCKLNDIWQQGGHKYGDHRSCLKGKKKQLLIKLWSAAQCEAQ
jgi:hypothetical protein